MRLAEISRLGSSPLATGKMADQNTMLHSILENVAEQIYGLAFLMVMMVVLPVSHKNGIPEASQSWLTI